MTRARDNAFYGDINGNELILDADGDTSITSDTDDQIDIKVGGSDKVVIDSSGNVTISANLTVNGTTTTINSTTLAVDDKNIELGSVDTPSDTTADGGGITLKGATDHTFNWVNSTDAWTSSEHLNLASGKEFKINNTSLKDVSETLTNKTINSASNTITITESNISDLGSYLENVVEDTTPQLGGNLDLNGNDITGTGNITVTGKGTFSGVGSFEALELITSDTNRVYMTGNSSVSGDMWRVGTLNSNPHLNISALQSSGDILFNTNGAQRMAIDTSGNLKFNSGYGSVQTAFGVRAWVFFNGTGTVSIFDSGNVSSITDLGTGVYGVNFSTAMPDTNYCPVGIAQRSGTTNSDVNVSERHNYTRTTSQVRIDVRIASSGASHDPTRCNVMVVR